MAQKRGRSQLEEFTAGQTQYSKSKTIEDRKSEFTAIYSPTIPPKQLQARPEFSSAMHCILAWRIPSKQTTLTGTTRYDTGHDDDGEQYGGKRLDRVLERENVTGAVVVARVYGGTNLGPVRFQWIDHCATEAIARWKRGERGEIAPQQPGDSKKPKMEEAVLKKSEIPTAAGPSSTMSPAEIQKQREALIKDLKQRDANIVALRDLLAQKKTKLNGVLSPTQPSPSKVPYYETLPLDRLQMLERARDATIAHLLKQLDKVDEELKEEEEFDAAMAIVAKAEDRKLDEEAFKEMETILREQDRQNKSPLEEADGS